MSVGMRISAMVKLLLPVIHGKIRVTFIRLLVSS